MRFLIKLTEEAWTALAVIALIEGEEFFPAQDDHGIVLLDEQVVWALEEQRESGQTLSDAVLRIYQDV